MASTEFKVVSWSPLDPITNEKMSAMVQNDNYLRDTMVRGAYRANGVNREAGLKIAGGLALITSGKAARKTRYVNFENFFSQSCKPIVTTGTVSAAQRQIFVTIDGPGSKPQPTRDGFQVHVFVESKNKKKKISRNFYVAWHALGF